MAHKFLHTFGSAEERLNEPVHRGLSKRLKGVVSHLTLPKLLRVIMKAAVANLVLEGGIGGDHAGDEVTHRVLQDHGRFQVSQDLAKVICQGFFQFLHTLHTLRKGMSKEQGYGLCPACD